MNLLKLAAFAALLIPTLLLSGEDPNPIAVRSRPMSEGAAEEELLEAAGFIFDHYPPVFFSSAHHFFVSVTVCDNDDRLLRLEDGSTWKVNSFDSDTTHYWRENDALIITQNQRWFSNSKYRIINKGTDSSVEANLFGGPQKQGPQTRYIIQIDSDRREIKLSDNTHWEISYLDARTCKDWTLSDVIIIGTNSGWDSRCEALLINVTLNNNARAHQF